MTAGWRFEFTPPARRDLKRLDPPIQRRVLAALRALVADPPVGQLVKLQALTNIDCASATGASGSDSPPMRARSTRSVCSRAGERTSAERHAHPRLVVTDLLGRLTAWAATETLRPWRTTTTGPRPSSNDSGRVRGQSRPRKKLYGRGRTISIVSAALLAGVAGVLALIEAPKEVAAVSGASRDERPDGSDEQRQQCLDELTERRHKLESQAPGDVHPSPPA